MVSDLLGLLALLAYFDHLVFPVLHDKSEVWLYMDDIPTCHWAAANISSVLANLNQGVGLTFKDIVTPFEKSISFNSLLAIA